MRIIFKRKAVKAQQHGYDCGIYAIKFLLFLFYGGAGPGIEYIANKVNISKEKGLSPDESYNFLKEYAFMDVRTNIPKHRYGYNVFGTIYEQESSIDVLKNNLPAMVNYQEEGEGHWGVIISSINGKFLLYDPWKGDLKFYSEGEFDKIWFSKRYYKRCFISIIKN